ncbi:toxin VapC [Sulfolobus acidocaldarius]|uniref:Conserved protein n=4 Tax=Sulfolobus acidocaldarius TaxID=2285 RepID=Q4J7J1_SULAC|nr:conserved protein [Sulfolobus acidocaldarius DSM 639]AGE71869.1 hypothetical protein SacN8_09560 [Sulfolobus acidocaldarius N8]AGE74141.1 hypothetical protein SacRon12I_09580 [Sulfolobus acidocaldarius Ron12/I]ALU29952.1 toxin VapC [Sulfolobus acidocaldarius]ALU32696.1 toxin VapC [Sulfolobus acidocaldarius]
MSGSLVLDSGVLLSFVEGKYKGIFNKIKGGEIRPIVSSLSLVETYYITCRALGVEKAEEVVSHLISSGLFRVVGVNRKVISEAGKCKCKYPISLTDCTTIATAKVKNTRALSREEKELKELNIPEVILIHE